MPTYNYRCSHCGHDLEMFHKINEQPSTTCPQCHKDGLTRRPSANVGLAFQGDGFYATMYGKNSNSNPTSTTSTASEPVQACCPCGKNKSSCSK